MKKDTITISINKPITNEEIKEIRELFKQDELYKGYKLNIIISGNDNLKDNLQNFVKAGLKT